MVQAGRRWALGVIWVWVCVSILLFSGISYGRSVTGFMKKANKHLQKAVKYGQEKNYAQAEAKCTKAIIMLKRANERRVEVGVKNPIAFEIDFYNMLAYAYFNRGISLYYQGDLECATDDFSWAQTCAQLGSSPDIEKKAVQLGRKVSDEMRRTGRRGRKVCPFNYH